MAHAYTPGLKVVERTVVRRERRLPLPGEILVARNEGVTGDRVVARTALPGNVTTVNVAGLLSIPPDDIDQVMLHPPGGAVAKDEVLAQSKGLFGLFRSQVRAPVAGTIESVSPITGQVIMREAPQPVEVRAYIDGTVREIFAREGVLVETEASLVQGIFGIGGETRGEIRVVAQSPTDVLTAAAIDESCADKIVVGGALVEHAALERARTVGARGIVAGGVEDETLRRFLGYDIGVAITGSEQKGVTLVVTEGFGPMRMAQHTFDLLRKLDRRLASMNGATQIRAGVIRPEVIVPLTGRPERAATAPATSGLEVGMLVRIIREPNFGLLGTVRDLPAELQLIETESRVRVLEVTLEDGRRVIVPRANVEIIEG